MSCDGYIKTPIGYRLKNLRDDTRYRTTPEIPTLNKEQLHLEGQMCWNRIEIFKATYGESGYPEKKELQFIREFDLTKNSPAVLIEYMRERWRWPDYLSIQSTGNGFWVEMHTGGWSGNEEMIEALQANCLFFPLYWKKTMAGGHYYFKIKENAEGEGRDQPETLTKQHLANLVLLELHQYHDGRRPGMKTAEDIVGLVKKGLRAVESGTTIHEFLKFVNVLEPEKKQSRGKTGKS